MQTRYRNERGERERERERGPKKKKLNAAGVRAQTRHENKRRAKETRSKKKRKKRGAPPRRHCSILQKKTLLSLPPPLARQARTITECGGGGGGRTKKRGRELYAPHARDRRHGGGRKEKNKGVPYKRGHWNGTKESSPCAHGSWNVTKTEKAHVCHAVRGIPPRNAGRVACGIDGYMPDKRTAAFARGGSRVDKTRHAPLQKIILHSASVLFTSLLSPFF